METKDSYLVDVFDPCNGFTKSALNNTGTDGVVSCVGCLASRFAIECRHMNLDALDEDELRDHFVDRSTLSIFHVDYDART